MGLALVGLIIPSIGVFAAPEPTPMNREDRVEVSKVVESAGLKYLPDYAVPPGETARHHSSDGDVSG